MKKYLLGIACLFSLAACMAQTDDPPLAGNWKSYLEDGMTFEFLQLNPDGSGIKCLGRTIGNKDSLFLGDSTTLLVRSWRIAGKYLCINTACARNCLLDSMYALRFIRNDRMVLTGGHLTRTVSYTRSHKDVGQFRIPSESEITARKIFAFRTIDSLTCLAEYKGFDDLIPHIFKSEQNYRYPEHYKDPPYQFMVPSTVKTISFGSGDQKFYIRLDSPEGDEPVTSIIVYYDFADQDRTFYFSQLKEGKEKKDIVRVGDKDIYRGISWQGKWEGRIYMDNKLWIAYYTSKKDLEGLLQQCIASFKYR